MTGKKNITTEETFALAVQNHKKNNLQVAENLYKKILKSNSNHFESIYYLGTLSVQTKNFDKARQLLLKAIEIRPNFAEAYNNLGIVFNELGEHEKAMSKFRKAIQIQPNFEKAHNNLGVAFGKLNEFQKAIDCYEKAIQILPNFENAHNNLGVAFGKLNEFQKAVDCYEKAIQINPNYAEPHNNLGIAFGKLNEFQKAIDCYEKAIQINPNYAEPHYNLGVTFDKLNEYQKVISCYEKAIQINPYYASAHNNMLFTLLYMEKTDPKYYLSKAKEFRSSLKPINDVSLLKYQFESRPKKLKIGFVSADFKQHPVGYFLLDTLKHLKNKNLELIAYSNSLEYDSLTVKLKSHFANWHEIKNQNDKKVINQIRKDGVHILVDLSGHSAKNRLPIFINKPAPIQVTWAGYLGSSGIPEIDYIIGDSFVTPHSENSHFTERVFRLPNIWVCFSIPEFEVKISELPAIKNGYITFGCFNNLSKINDKVISLWSKILKAIPGSKIFLKTKKLNNLYIKKMIINNFQKNNIGSNSIILEGDSPRRELLASYNKVDIALDPFPYSGGTSSFEATWMSTPVLTKKGTAFLAHSTESINHNCGMSDWVANDENEYVKKAIKFSANLEQLSEIKKKLRKITLNSPLFNASLFAEHFKVAVWNMWKDFI